MSREIKFRAWDTFNNRMVYEPYRFYPMPQYDKDNGEIGDYNYYESWQDEEDGVSRPCFLMQYTGLKDKNGKEVYEGDIVRVHHVMEVPSETEKAYEKIEEHKTGTVIWNYATFSFKNHLSAERLKSHQEAFPQSDTDEIGPIAYYCDPETENTVEVIGNIYENPELLK